MDNLRNFANVNGFDGAKLRRLFQISITLFSVIFSKKSFSCFSRGNRLAKCLDISLRSG